MDTLPALPGEEYVSGLSIKQERFCFFVSRGLSAAEAYRQAKYKVKTAGAAKSAASRLLTNVNVKAFIKHLRDVAVAKSIADLVEVKQGLTQIFRGRMGDYVNVNANGNVAVIPTNEALNSAAVQEVTTRTERIGGHESPITADITTIKLRDPVRAAELLSKISGWHSDAGANVYNDNRQININDNASAKDKLVSKLNSIAVKVGAGTANSKSDGGGS